MDRNFVRNNIPQPAPPTPPYAGIAYLVQQTIAGITPHWKEILECWLGTVAGLNEGWWRQA